MRKSNGFRDLTRCELSRGVLKHRSANMGNTFALPWRQPHRGQSRIMRGFVTQKRPDGFP